jgi:hypothetical protein
MTSERIRVGLMSILIALVAAGVIFVGLHRADISN